jgi:hypothetical protein
MPALPKDNTMGEQSYENDFRPRQKPATMRKNLLDDFTTHHPSIAATTL